MKKIVFTLLSICMIAIAASAQTADVSKDAAKAAKAAEKEAKAKYKALQTENIVKTLKQIGATDKEIAAFQEALQDASAKGTEIKKNEALSEEEKESQLKANADAKNAKLKEIIGEARYKEYNRIRKEQKPAEEAIVAPYKQ
ncbi:hypothetical protein [Aridibaculum aurantiacum]|uniref:hypothetical protein n=1 Tax=Aridibaculum aurantiacum TaxID=2810307 RepID=UPI001A974793|nr:hypothetical protein [Aridibaculum aurantiacum]